MNIEKNDMNVDIVDLHSHILPCQDHGSDCLETSLQQLTLAKKHNVTRIFATPHFYPHSHRVEKFLQGRSTSYGILSTFLNGNMPKVKLGAEILICSGLEKMEGLSKLTLEGSNSLLIELPFERLSVEHSRTIEKLLSADYKIIIAHADRYHPDDIESLFDYGVSIQLNASSLTSFIRKKHLFGWIDTGMVSFLGSDIHLADKKAYYNFEKSIKLFGSKISAIKSRSDSLWNGTSLQ